MLRPINKTKPKAYYDLPTSVPVVKDVNGVSVVEIKDVCPPIGKQVNIQQYSLRACAKRNELKRVNTKILNGDAENIAESVENLEVDLADVLRETN